MIHIGSYKFTSVKNGILDATLREKHASFSIMIGVAMTTNLSPYVTYVTQQ